MQTDYILNLLCFPIRLQNSVVKIVNFAKAITPATKAVYAETIGNPLNNVLDISAVAQQISLLWSHQRCLLLQRRHVPGLKWVAMARYGLPLGGSESYGL